MSISCALNFAHLYIIILPLAARVESLESALGRRTIDTIDFRSSFFSNSAENVLAEEKNRSIISGRVDNSNKMKLQMGNFPSASGVQDERKSGGLRKFLIKCCCGKCSLGVNVSVVYVLVLLLTISFILASLIGHSRLKQIENENRRLWREMRIDQMSSSNVDRYHNQYHHNFFFKFLWHFLG